MNREKIYYLGHSAFVVEADDYFFIFDAQDENYPSEFFDLNKLSDKKVRVFFSHRHHDHYCEKLHAACANLSNAFIFLGNFESGICKNTKTLKPRESFEFDGMTARAADSTDDGVCFLVQTEKITIFHAGDNADWGDGEQNAAYYGEIDYLAGLNLKIDLAFIPVCTYSGRRPEDMTRGAVYAIEKLKPASAFPMHANGREFLYEEFEKDLRKTGSEAKIVCAKRAGLL